MPERERPVNWSEPADDGPDDTYTIADEYGIDEAEDRYLAQYGW